MVQDRLLQAVAVCISQARCQTLRQPVAGPRVASWCCVPLSDTRTHTLEGQGQAPAYAMHSCCSHPLLVLVILLLIVPCVDAVCRHCWGTIPGCPGTATDDQCTSLTGVAANVAALVAGATTLVSCQDLLPVYLLRVFTRRVLETLTQVARRGSGAVVYSFTGKTPDDIIRAASPRAP